MRKPTNIKTPETQAADTTEQPSATLKAVLEHQVLVLQAQQELDRLHGLKIAYEQKLTGADQVENAMRSMSERMQDLMADIAAGENKQQELEELQGQYAQANDSLCTPELDKADCVVPGLVRKIEGAQAALQALQAKRPALMRAMLMEEAVALGAQYAEAALKTKELFHRLFVLNDMLLAHGRTISLTTGANLELPLFELDSVRPHADFNFRGHIVRGPFLRRDVMGYAAAERERIAGLGVDLTPDAT